MIADFHVSNPILVEVVRGQLVESAHRGALVLARATDGDLVCALGDIDRAVFPRSAIKALQCLPLVESGAAGRFGFGAAEIALACASHTGNERHTAIAAGMLRRAGLGEEALGCGAHPPLGNGAAKSLTANGGPPSQLHNNCSGKHAGMLATAVHMGEPIEHYWETAHPVQERVRSVLAEMMQVELRPDRLGIDGCSVPTWAVPLEALAAAFARFGSRHGLGAARREAAKRIIEACWREPALVAGPGRADTLVMAKLPGRVFMKTGAEGVYAGAFPELELGFAIKIDDGATRASAGTAMALVERLYPAARGLLDRQRLRSWRGADVGSIRSSAELQRALASLPAPAE